MTLVRILDDLSPHVGVATAVLPFVVAMLLRLVLGKSRLAGVLISLSTAWFALNVFVAPYSPGMQEDLIRLRSFLR
jgi:hypothetical protein